MKKFQYIGKIEILKRLNNSVNGNPRFLIELLDSDNFIELQTKSDYSYNYNIENLIMKQCNCIVEYYYTKNGNGKIQDITEIK